MIVKMSKTYIVVRMADKDRLFNALGRMTLLHIEPIHPDEAAADEKMLQEIEDLSRAVEILAAVKPAGDPLDRSPLDAAREVIAIRSKIAENRDRLSALHRTAAEVSVWGNIALEQFERLREAGIEVRFFSLPRDFPEPIAAECVEILADLPEYRTMAAVVDRNEAFTPPEWAVPMQQPPRTLPDIREEAARIDAELKAGVLRLGRLAKTADAIRQEQRRTASEIAHIEAVRSGMDGDELFAVKGWAPTEITGGLARRLADLGVEAAVRFRLPRQDESPPTLVRRPGWAKPIKGLFDILGVLPGYREIDLSPFFMIALPLFAAMLIGDAGYGFLIALFGLIFFHKLARTTGLSNARLIVVFGLTALLWGVLTANYFGVSPETLAQSGGYTRAGKTGERIDYEALWSGSGFHSSVARMMRRAAPLWRQDGKQARTLLIQVSLIIGCLHLILGRFRRLTSLFPNQKALAELGWMVALSAMLTLIWSLLFFGPDRTPKAVGWAIAAAVFLTSWFGKPDKNPIKRVAIGFASSLLPLLNTFSDTMSYIRLFAVGLASTYIAAAFNILGARAAETATWFSAIPILIFGHALNIGLAGIAIFAHGVRLNMLEFSNQAGVEWAGTAYRPFACGQVDAAGEEKL